LSIFYRLRAITWSFLVVILCTFTCLSVYLWQRNPVVAQENQLLENAQVILLLLALAINIFRMMESNKAKLVRDIRIGLSLCTFALFLREVDIDQLNLGEQLRAIETSVRTVCGLLLLVFFAYLFRRRYYFWLHSREIIRSPMVYLSILGCLLYVAGWPFDKKVFSMDFNISQLIEETIELNAALIFILSSLADSKTVKAVRAPNT
jgi:hypothetical protein